MGEIIKYRRIHSMFMAAAITFQTVETITAAYGMSAKKEKSTWES